MSIHETPPPATDELAAEQEAANYAAQAAAMQAMNQPANGENPTELPQPGAAPEAAQLTPVVEAEEPSAAQENPAAVVPSAGRRPRRRATHGEKTIDPADYPPADPQTAAPAASNERPMATPTVLYPRDPRSWAGHRTRKAHPSTPAGPHPMGTVTPIPLAPRGEKYKMTAAVRMANILESLHDTLPTSVAELKDLHDSVEFEKEYEEGMVRGRKAVRATGNYVDAEGNRIDPRLVQRFEEALEPANYLLNSDNLAEARRIVLAGKPDNLGNVTRAALARWREPGEANDVMALRRAKDYYRARILLNADLRQDDKLSDRQLGDLKRRQLATEIKSTVSEKEGLQLAKELGFTFDEHERGHGRFFILTEEERQDIPKRYGVFTEQAFTKFKSDLTVQATRHRMALEALQAADEIAKLDSGNLQLRRARKSGTPAENLPQPSGQPDAREVAVAALKKGIAAKAVKRLANSNTADLLPIQRRVLDSEITDTRTLIDEIEKAKTELQNAPANPAEAAQTKRHRLAKLSRQAGKAVKHAFVD